MRDPVVVYPPGQRSLFAREWQRALRSENKSKNTIFVYLHAVRLLDEWGVGPLEVQAAHIRAFIAELIERTSPGNAHTNYRSLRTFFRWLEDEEEIARSLMARTKAP